MTAKSGPFIANGYTKTAGSTTEYQLWDTTGGIYMGGVLATPPSTVAFTIVGTVATQTLTNKTLGAGTVVPAITETTTANLANTGLSLLTYSSAANTYTIAAPVAGCQKTIVLQSTIVPDTTAIFMSVYSGSTAIFFRTQSTAYKEYLYLGFLPPYSQVTMTGISATQWAVQSVINANASTNIGSTNTSFTS